MPPILQSDEVLVNRKSTSPTVNPFSTISASFGFCHVFSVTSSLCSRIQSRAPRCIGLLYFLCPLRSMTISQSFSIFMTVSILRNTSPISCRMSSNLGLSDFFFFHDLTEVMNLSKKSTKMKCPSCHIIWGYTWHSQDVSGDVDLHHLAKVVSARFLNCALLFLPFQTLFSGSKWLSLAYSRGGGVGTVLWRWKYLQILNRMLL